MSLLIALALAAAEEAVDLPAFIECRTADPTMYQRFASRLAEDEKSVTRALGWTPERSGNPLLQQYRLPRPITAFGRQVDRIAFTSSGLLAIIAEPDPHGLARELRIQPMIDSRAKYLGERVIFEGTERAGGTALTHRIALNVSTVDTHPGKTLAGCNYSIEIE